MLEIRNQLNQAISAIHEFYKGTPRIGIILGTGLGRIVDSIEIQVEIPYSKIPHFVIPTVEFHTGELIFGNLNNVHVMAMKGRFHTYEGWSMQEITFPVRVMKALGVEVVIVSNAAGGLNPQFRNGDIMLITDHINLLGDNPLIGFNDDELGLRFPDMCDCYPKILRDLAEETALEQNLRIVHGVYVAVQGPNLETAAEYRYLRSIGADAVGMSTVPEVVVAIHSGMKVLGFSIITDMGLPDALTPCTLEDIISIANAADDRMAKLIFALAPKLEKEIYS